MPLKQRVPKLKGFNNPFRVEYQAVNLDTLAELAEQYGPTIDPQVLVEHGVLHKGAYVKVLARGELIGHARRPRPRRVQGRRGGDHGGGRYGDARAAAVHG